AVDGHEGDDGGDLELDLAAAPHRAGELGQGEAGYVVGAAGDEQGVGVEADVGEPLGGDVDESGTPGQDDGHGAGLGAALVHPVDGVLSDVGAAGLGAGAEVAAVAAACPGVVEAAVAVDGDDLGAAEVVEGGE